MQDMILALVCDGCLVEMKANCHEETAGGSPQKAGGCRVLMTQGKAGDQASGHSGDKILVLE